MGDTYNPVIQEDPKDLTTLGGNNFQLQVAKCVASPPGSAPVFNVVYASNLLAPTIDVKWQTQYGLNWSTEMPAVGAKVTFFGNWQPVDLGQSYDLNKEGLWTVNDANPNASPVGINIGTNGYQPVHIIVGINDPTAGWTPIYVNADKLPEFAHGEYQPIEQVRLWYEDDEKSATMITGQGTPPIVYTLPADHPHYFWYDTTTGKWKEQGVPFAFPTK